MKTFEYNLKHRKANFKIKQWWDHNWCLPQTPGWIRHAAVLSFLDSWSLTLQSMQSLGRQDTEINFPVAAMEVNWNETD